MLTVLQLKKICSALCEYYQLREMYEGQYDVQASIMAASNFDHLVQHIEADSAEDLLRQVTARVTTRQSKSDDFDGKLDGQYGGGKGSYGSLLRQFEEACSCGDSYERQLQALKKHIRELEQRHRPKRPTLILAIYRWFSSEIDFYRSAYPRRTQVFIFVVFLLFVYWLNAGH